MKIGLSCYPTFGGSGVVASELGMALADRGHEVHFITYAVPGRLNLCRPGVFYHEVTVPDYPLFEYPPYSLALASKMAEVARREGLSVMHAHYAIPHAASALLARDILNGELKVVTTLHGTDVTLVGRDPSFLPVTRHAILASDAVSAVSLFLRSEVCRTFTCDKPIRVIPNFIDPGEYEGIDTGPWRRRFAPQGEKVITHISNFRPVKRIDDVIEIFLAVRRKLPARLILVGTGPDLPKAEQKIHDHQAEQDVFFLGNQLSIIEILSASDILLLPSQTESFGLAALEAMAAGAVPIATESGGLPEVVQHGVTGFLAPVGEVETMVRYALELLTNASLLEKISAAAKAEAREKFNIETALDAYEDLYRSVL
ncbi:MAG: N-acetyl-alpha-D-glucosaminyl L-malate synthase BshA [Calditrichota bacterium]